MNTVFQIRLRRPLLRLIVNRQLPLPPPPFDSMTRHLLVLVAVALLAWAYTPYHLAAQDLRLEITADRSPVTPDGRVGYTAAVSNVGSSSVSDVVVEIQLPDAISGFYENTTSDPSGVACDSGSYSNFCEAGETLIWTLSEINAGESLTLLYGLLISDAASEGTYTTSATASASGQTSVNTGVDVIVDTAPVVTLGVASDPGPVEAGTTLVYRLDYGALASQGGAEDATLQLELPANTIFLSASGGGSESSGVVTWSLGAIEEGRGGERTVTVSVGSGLENGTLLRARAALLSGVSGATDAQTDYVLTVHPPSALHVAFTADGVPAASNDRVNFALTISNTSGLSATGTTVRFVLPSSISGFYERVTSDPTNVSCDTFSYSNFCEAGEILIWTPGGLEAGESRTLFFEDKLSNGGDVGGKLLRLRGVAASSRGVQRFLAESYRIDPDPVATLSLAGDLGPVPPGESYTYHLDYGALEGAGGLADATLRLELPAGVTFSSASDNGSENDGVVTWTLGAIDEGDGDEQTVTVTVGEGLSNGEILTARSTLDPGTPDNAAMRSEHAVPIQSASNPLQVALSVGDVPGRPDSRVDFALTVSNASDQSLTETTVRLVLPEFISGFYERVTSDPTNVSCDTFSYSNFCEAGEILIWTPGGLKAGESRTLLFEDKMVSVAEVRGGELLRLRGVTSASRGSQQVFMNSHGVDSSPVSALGLSVALTPVEAGTDYDYSVTYGALSGAGGTTGATLRLELPDGVTFLSASGGGSESEGVVTWALGPLNEDEGGKRSATVQTGEDLDNGTVLLARATLEVEDEVERTLRASYPVVIGIRSLSLDVTSSHSFIGHEEQATYDIEITARNDGSLSVSGSTVQVVLPVFIDGFGEDETSDPGNVSCDTFSYSNFCEAGEILIWTPGDLDAGEEQTFTLSPSATLELGDLLRHRFVATAAETQEVSGALDLPIVDSFTLPVELTAFDATLDGDGVLIQWSTASETNNAGFEVQMRRGAEGTFAAQGFVDGVGTTVEAQTYRFRVEDLAPGPYAFRLKQVDLDGTAEMSPVVEVTVAMKEAYLLSEAFPNPFRGAAWLTLQVREAQTVRADLYDVLGRRVATLHDGTLDAGREHRLALNGRGLSSGLYLVRIVGERFAETRRVVVTR